MTIEPWALAGRTPRSIDISAVIGGLDTGAAERLVIRQSTIYQLFKEPEDVLSYVQGKERMSRSICRDLVRAKRIWKDMGIGISRKRAAELFDKENP